MPRLRLLLSFLCLLLASASSVHPTRPHRRPRLQTRIALRESDSALQRLRGGRGGGANGAAEARARLLLLASNAGFGSYSVFLRALSQVPGAVPLGTVFITFVRYNVLLVLATVTLGLGLGLGLGLADPNPNPNPNPNPAHGAGAHGGGVSGRKQVQGCVRASAGV